MLVKFSCPYCKVEHTDNFSESEHSDRPIIYKCETTNLDDQACKKRFVIIPKFYIELQISKLDWEQKCDY